MTLSLWAHAYRHPQLGDFPLKEGYIEYSLGPLPSLAEGSGADALLFLYATDHIQTRGRIALQIVGAVLGGLGESGGGGGSGQALLATALVDPQTGDLLWFYTVDGCGWTDLRKPTSTDRLIRRAFESLRESASSWREKGK